jgi:enoyl-CoA hydratase/carnithine racemase
MAELTKIGPAHLRREAWVYVRQSTMTQVRENTESLKRQYELVERAHRLGWPADRVRVVVVQGAGTSFSSGIDLRMFSAEGVPGEEPLPRADDPAFEQWIAVCQQGFTWLR